MWQVKSLCLWWPSCQPPMYLSVFYVTGNIRSFMMMTQLSQPPMYLSVFYVTGNILSFVVMSRPSFHKSTTSMYLRVLAVVDTSVLYVGLLRQWIKSVKIKLINFRKNTMNYYYHVKSKIIYYGRHDNYYWINNPDIRHTNLIT